MVRVNIFALPLNWPIRFICMHCIFAFVSFSTYLYLTIYLFYLSCPFKHFGDIKVTKDRNLVFKDRQNVNLTFHYTYVCKSKRLRRKRKRKQTLNAQNAFWDTDIQSNEHFIKNGFSNHKNPFSSFLLCKSQLRSFVWYS